MKRYYVSEQFDAFLMERMSGSEFDFFQKRIGPLSIYPVRFGAFQEDYQAPGSERTVRFSYFFSEKLGLLFVLGAHLVRRGEPTDFDQEQMSAFMEAIREWEAHPARVPEAFQGDQK